MVWAGVAFHGFVRVTSHMEQSRKSLYVHVCVSVWLIIAKGGDSHLTAKVIVFLSYCLLSSKWKASRPDYKTRLSLLLAPFRRKS